MTKSTEKRLFTNILGNKSGFSNQIDEYSSVFEPFGGSAAISLNMPNARVIIGETDHIVYLAYKHWIAGTLDVPKSIENHEELYEAANAVLAGNRDTDLIGKAFLLRQSVFGGVMRTNKSGKINVKIAEDKLRRALARRLPQPPADMTVLEDAYQVMERLDGSSTLCVIDPPYFNPRSTPCYPEHNPKDPKETLNALEYVRQSITAKADILVSAYLDEDMRLYLLDIVQVAKSEGYGVRILKDNPLTTLSNVTRSGAKEKPSEYVVYLRQTCAKIGEQLSLGLL